MNNAVTTRLSLVNNVVPRTVLLIHYCFNNVVVIIVEAATIVDLKEGMGGKAPPPPIALLPLPPQIKPFKVLVKA